MMYVLVTTNCVGNVEASTVLNAHTRSALILKIKRLTTMISKRESSWAKLSNVAVS